MLVLVPTFYQIYANWFGVRMPDESIDEVLNDSPRPAPVSAATVAAVTPADG